MPYNNKYYSFTEDTVKYSVVLRHDNVSGLVTVLGLTASDDRPDDATNVTIKEAVIDHAVMVPIKLEMTKTGKSRQAFVPCPKGKVDTALKQTGGLKGLKYGDWTIQKAYAELDKKYTY